MYMCLSCFSYFIYYEYLWLIIIFIGVILYDIFDRDFYNLFFILYISLSGFKIFNVRILGRLKEVIIFMYLFIRKCIG